MRPLICALSAMVFSSLVVAQTDSVIGVAGMSPNELDQKLNDAFRSVHGPAVRRQMLAEAMATKRIDLIQVCFANPETVLETAQAIRELPDGELKQRATIMMLRTPTSIFWPTENALTISNIITPPVMSEPFISVTRQLLPNVQLTENWLKYQVGRIKLADEMEAVLDARATQAKRPHSADVELSPKPEGAHSTGAYEKHSTVPGPSQSALKRTLKGFRMMTVVLTSALAVALAWWLVSRKK